MATKSSQFSCKTKSVFPDSASVAPESIYVTRSGHEERNLLSSEKRLVGDGGDYTILFGPKGAEKSYSVARVFLGIEGVVTIVHY